MELIFERSVEGRNLTVLPALDVAQATPSFAKRAKAPKLPEVSENDISRHYTELAKNTQGVNDGAYPLGSCTMKYNPKVNEEVASLAGFTAVHPLQPIHTVQGSLEMIDTAERVFSEITGMDAMTFQPAAGAHGEFVGLLLMKAYHESRGEGHRNKIIVPDAAHGTNPASAVMAGYKVINIKSNEKGLVDLDSLRAAVGDDTAGLMLTNPNTLGLFDENILEITKIVHDAGGVNYYDGANLNAVMGLAKPGDMGFDVIHLNLHKTFSTPHGGGGPGSGPVGCKEFLKPFIPGILTEADGDSLKMVKPSKTTGQVKAFYGNFLVTLKALTYALTLGCDGLREASSNAVLNSNYLRTQLSKAYTVQYNTTCLHEFVISLEPEKNSHNVTAMDISKALLDYGFHPPTMYFPLIVPEALMFEPTETESKESMDSLIAALLDIHEKAMANPEWIKHCPYTKAVKRMDEVGAARNPILRYNFA